MVCFELFARPMIEGLSGATPSRLAFPQARLRFDVKVKPGLTRFLPARFESGGEGATVEFLPWHGSGDVVTQARANCLLVVPPDRELLKSGDLVSILPV
jgi:molybdopterin molybdotransferase